SGPSAFSFDFGTGTADVFADFDQLGRERPTHPDLGGGPAADTITAYRRDEEVMRAGPAGVRLPWFLPYFDPLQQLNETPEMRLAYRRMLADPNVKAPVRGKILGVAALELQIRPPDKDNPRDVEIAEFVKWNLTERLCEGVIGLVWDVFSGGL